MVLEPAARWRCLAKRLGDHVSARTRQAAFKFRHLAAAQTPEFERCLLSSSRHVVSQPLRQASPAGRGLQDHGRTHRLPWQGRPQLLAVGTCAKRCVSADCISVCTAGCSRDGRAHCQSELSQGVDDSTPHQRQQGSLRESDSGGPVSRQDARAASRSASEVACKSSSRRSL